MPHYADAFARLDAFVEQRMETLNIPGVSIGITDRERSLRVKTYGYADLATRTPLEPQHLLGIGSATKPFTAIAVLQLHEQGLIDLHAPITDYLPWFEVQSQQAPITVHHLLSHTAGLVRGPDFSPDKRFEVWSLRNTVAATPPGSFFSYSDMGYNTLGVMLETLLRQPYGEIIRTRILDPLGMSATDPVVTNATRDRLATGYRVHDDDRPASISTPLVPVDWREYGKSDGCIVSTPEDMTAFLRMLLNRGAGPGGSILSEASFALMTRPVADLAWWIEASKYGYGIGIGYVDGRTRVAHGGWFSGHLSSMIADMDDGIGVMVMLNCLSTNPHQFALHALDQLHAALHGGDLPDAPPVPDPQRIPNACDYAGRYTNAGRSLTIAAEDERLYLAPEDGPGRVALEGKAWDWLVGWGPDAFLADYPDFQHFLLRFGREIQGDAGSPVIELSYGSDWYAGERYAGPTTFSYPNAWDAYTGHFRRLHPWESNFRVVQRKGALWMVDCFWNAEIQLVELEEGIFRVGADERAAERIHFDAIADGQALRANVSGADYYRFFTP